MFRSLVFLLANLAAIMPAQLHAQAPATDLGTHGYADSDGVKIHYVTAGDGPLVIMIHGFPDYWYTWRAQMPALAQTHQVVAIDQRGYNLSDQPEGVENYTMQRLTNDVRAVVGHFGKTKAIIVGHDWGGAVAWSLAMSDPEFVDRLMILNLPHPYLLQRELATNPEQQTSSEYARHFQRPDAAAGLTAETLAMWVGDAEARKKYIDAFRRSSFDAMLNYYKANFPTEPYQVPSETPPKVQCSVLMIHGLKDQALLPGALNGTWNWVEKDLTLITLPDAGHFVQQDAAEFVTGQMVRWLQREKP